MVQAKQKNLRVFEFEETPKEDLIPYIQKNAVLLRGFMLIFKGALDEEVRAFLQSEGLNFLDSSIQLPLKSRESSGEIPSKNITTPAPLEESGSKGKEHSRSSTLCLRRTIRSGEEIVTSGDVTIFGRINSGAIIRAEGNVQVFGEIHGAIECEGEYMILGKIGQGSVLFGGEILDPSLFHGSLKQVFLEEGRVSIKEIV
ncbi:septum site-determining protein MinC [Wolinella succinogenes]|uniref:septum site-determining protein MinC n=1 Tax=Wolinella succinogenes TaxID=844 RepID=UPI0024098EFE|nr:septum site-determining protein MinC [Wolinella succinogenes]